MTTDRVQPSPEPVEWKDARVIQVNESADAAWLARIAVIAAEAHARGYREGLERGAVWVGEWGDVEGSRLEGVFATHEDAMLWLIAERERQIANAQSDWERAQVRFAPDNEEEMARYAQTFAAMDEDKTAGMARMEVLEWFAEERAAPPATFTEIAEDRFESTEWSGAGQWTISEWPVIGAIRAEANPVPTSDDG